MDNAVVREQIKTALDTVAGVRGYVRKPDAPKPGDGWPLWRGAERADGMLFAQTWGAVVMCTQDFATADAFADSHGQSLVEALQQYVMFVDSMAPILVPTSAGDVPALMITGRCE